MKFNIQKYCSQTSHIAGDTFSKVHRFWYIFLKFLVCIYLKVDVEVFTAKPSESVSDKCRAVPVQARESVNRYQP